jgi:hypothetical protein
LEKKDSRVPAAAEILFYQKKEAGLQEFFVEPVLDCFFDLGFSCCSLRLKKVRKG